MANRNPVKPVTFKMRYELRDYDGLLPANDYQIETEGHALNGISLTEYRDVLTLLHLHPASKHAKIGSRLTIDPSDLGAAYFRVLTSRESHK